MITQLMEWFITFAKGIGEVWNWLWTPYYFELLDMDIVPVYLVVGSVAIIGLLRRVL